MASYPSSCSDQKPPLLQIHPSANTAAFTFGMWSLLSTCHHLDLSHCHLSLGPLNSPNSVHLALTVNFPHSNTPILLKQVRPCQCSVPYPRTLSHSQQIWSLTHPTRPWPSTHHYPSDSTSHNHAPADTLNLLLLVLHSRHMSASGPLHKLFLLQGRHFLQTSTKLNPSPPFLKWPLLANVFTDHCF